MGQMSCFSRLSMRSTPAIQTDTEKKKKRQELDAALETLRLFLDRDVSCYRDNMPL